MGKLLVIILCQILILFSGCSQSSIIEIANKTEPGDRLTIAGKVVDDKGTPIANAKLFFYQANSHGEYESTFLGMPSFARLRGTVYSDKQGNFTLLTIIPGNYPGEPDGKHIHVVANAKGHKEWRFEFLFEGSVSESLRKEIAIKKDGMILNPTLGNPGTWHVDALIKLAKNNPK